jgi:MFS family permease
VAAAFAQIHIVAPFFAVGALAFVSAGLIWFYLPERTRPSPRVSAKQEYRRAALKWHDRRALPWVIVSIILSFAQSIVMQLCAFYFMDVLHIKGDAAMQMVSVGLMAMAMATLFAQIGLIQRFNLSVQFLMRWGSIIMIFSFIGLVVGNSYGLLVAALTLAGLGFGLLRPGLQAGASLSVSRRDQGAMAGFISGTSATGMILTPFIFLNSLAGFNIYDFMHSAPFMVGAVLMMLVLAFALYHPSMKNLNQAADDFEDEEEGLGLQ